MPLASDPKDEIAPLPSLDKEGQAAAARLLPGWFESR
jgi:hypothetical protein